MSDWSYESVEYSEGYIHSVFDGKGRLVCDCNSEAEAKRIAETKLLIKPVTTPDQQQGDES